MDKALLDKIIELVRSNDPEHHELGKVLFVENKPTSEDYMYFDNYFNIFAGTVPEEFIERWGRDVRYNQAKAAAEAREKDRMERLNIKITK